MTFFGGEGFQCMCGYIRLQRVMFHFFVSKIVSMVISSSPRQNESAACVLCRNASSLLVNVDEKVMSLCTYTSSSLVVKLFNSAI